MIMSNTSIDDPFLVVTNANTSTHAPSLMGAPPVSCVSIGIVSLPLPPSLFLPPLPLALSLSIYLFIAVEIVVGVVTTEKEDAFRAPTSIPRLLRLLRMPNISCSTCAITTTSYQSQY